MLFWCSKSMSSEGVGEDCLAWAARDASGVLSPYKFNRRYICYASPVFDDMIRAVLSFEALCWLAMFQR